MSAIGLILLAAGASTRMGTPKQLLPLHGRSLLRHSAEVAIASCCDPVVVVLGSQAEQIQADISELPLHTIQNPQWANGMGTSIVAGMAALTAIEADVDAVVVMLCDQPFVSAEVINHLVQSYQTIGNPIIASAYANTVGVPALFDRSLFTELLTLKADTGAKQLIKQHSKKVLQVAFPAGAIDLDTPAQYQQLLTDRTTTDFSSNKTE